MRLLSWIIGLPVAVAAVLFAISNRHPVKLELWPLPFSVDVPVYLAVLGPLALGMIAGGLIAWGAAGRSRRAARRERRRVEELERQVEVLRQPATDAEGRPLMISGNGASQP